jgi:hypothetical protein
VAKFFVDTTGKFATGVVDTGGNFSTGVVSLISVVHLDLRNISMIFRKKLKMTLVLFSGD